MSDEQVEIPRPLYDSLINQATTFAVVARKWGIVLSEEFERGINEQCDALEGIIAQCPPTKETFTGEFDESRVMEDVFRHDSQPERSGPPVGIRLSYPPTGHKVESYSKPTQEANRASAMRALRGMVEKHARDLRRAGTIL